MNHKINELREKYKLEIVSPFNIRLNDEEIKFDCLIKGYGAPKGMVIDSKWEKISPVEQMLIDLEYGYSCFDIHEGSVDGFSELLSDWGKINT